MKARYSDRTAVQTRNKYNKKILKGAISQLRAQGQLDPELVYSVGVGKPLENLSKVLFDIENASNVLNIFTSLLSEVDDHREKAKTDTQIYDPTAPRAKADVERDFKRINDILAQDRAKYFSTPQGRKDAKDPVAKKAYLDKEAQIRKNAISQVPRWGRTFTIAEGDLLPPTGDPSVTVFTKETLSQLVQSGEKLINLFLHLKQGLKLVEKEYQTLDSESIAKLTKEFKILKSEMETLLSKFPSKDVDDFKMMATAGLSDIRVEEMESVVRNLVGNIFASYKSAIGDGKIEDLIKARQAQVGSGISDLQPDYYSDIPLRFT